MVNECAKCQHMDFEIKSNRYMDVLFLCKFHTEYFRKEDGTIIKRKKSAWTRPEDTCKDFEGIKEQIKTVEVIKEVIKEVPVEKIVEKIVEVPGPERIVEKIVEKIVYREREEEPEEAEVFVCDQCSKIYATESSLKRHITMKHPEVEQ